nr:hypothetical protein [Kitasatospora aureofaciens]
MDDLDAAARYLGEQFAAGRVPVLDSEGPPVRLTDPDHAVAVVTGAVDLDVQAPDLGPADRPGGGSRIGAHAAGEFLGRDSTRKDHAVHFPARVGQPLDALTVLILGLARTVTDDADHDAPPLAPALRWPDAAGPHPNGDHRHPSPNPVSRAPPTNAVAKSES